MIDKVCKREVQKKTIPESIKIAENLLKEYNLLDRKDSDISELSGGQKQRLAIIRTLALNPKVLCLDEPTSSLDPLLTNYVCKSIENLADKGNAVLITSHDMTIFKYISCSIYLLQNGTITESSTSEELLTKPQNYPLIKSFIS